MEKDEELFQIKQCKIKLDVRLQAFDCFDRYLVFGDDKGNLFTFNLNEETGECTPEQSSLVGTGKIEQLKCHSVMSIAFVLSGGVVHVVTIPRLEKLCKTDQIKDIHKFALNTHYSKPNEIIMITKKKAVKVLEYNHEMRKFADTKPNSNLVVPELPDLVELHKEWMNLISKKKSILLDLDGRGMKLDYDITNCKNVNGSWLIYTDGVGIFMELNVPKGQNTIDFSNKPLLSINTFKNFVVSLHDSLLKVFDGHESLHIQDVQFDNGCAGRFMAIGRHIYFLVQNFAGANDYKLYLVSEMDYKKQIDRALGKDNFEYALQTFNNNVPPTDDSKMKRLEDFYLDCAWISFKKLSFEKAAQYFRLTNFDPSSLIYIFQNTLVTKIKSSSFQDELIRQNCSVEALTNNDLDKISRGLMLLYQLLQDKRLYFMTSYVGLYYNGELKDALNSNQKLQFANSRHAILSCEKYEMILSEHLTLINTTLLKILIKNKSKPNEIRDLIDSDYFTRNAEDLNDFLDKNSIGAFSDYAKITSAYLCEKDKRWDEALRLWQEFGNKKDYSPELASEAKERTKSILYFVKDPKLFETFIPWMLLKFQDDAFKVFNFYCTLQESKQKQEQVVIVSIDYFFNSILLPLEKDKNEKELREKFLEHYVRVCPNSDKYITFLCDIYIEKLFKLRSPKDAAPVIEGNVKVYYEKLVTIIKSSEFYDKEYIKSKITDSWMIDLEIHLMAMLEYHKEAIQKLIAIGLSEDKFDSLEKYCLEVKPKSGFEMISEMFIALTEMYNLYFKNNKGDKICVTLKKQILSILKRYGDSSKLNLFVVMKYLPGEWQLSEQAVFEYLVRTIKNNNHTSNKYKIARAISEMSLLCKEREVIEAKNKKVEIGNDSICGQCSKRIGSTIFVVYPNMKYYHTKCAPNPNVCPSTKVDFSKKLNI